MDKPKSTGSTGIDLTELQTQAGREAASQINRSIEASDTRTHRLTQVIADFALFPRDGQLAMTEAAIMWAFASMARHARAADAESRFYSMVDMAYVFTRDAFTTLSESERNQLAVGATAIHDYLLTDSGPIFAASVEAVQRLSEEDAVRVLAETLLPVYQQLLDHASMEQLKGLVMHCCRLCLDLELTASGIGCDVAKAIVDVFRAASAVTKSVRQGIQIGSLAIKDGKIIAIDHTP